MSKKNPSEQSTTTKKVAKTAKKAIKHAADESPSALSKGPSSSHKPHTTTIIATIDIGWGNALYLRGEGAGLNWERGILMDNIGTDRWEWKTVAPHPGISFKFLINDQVWSSGENFFVVHGGTSLSSPEFDESL